MMYVLYYRHLENPSSCMQANMHLPEEISMQSYGEWQLFAHCRTLKLSIILNYKYQSLPILKPITCIFEI